MGGIIKEFVDTLKILRYIHIARYIYTQRYIYRERENERAVSACSANLEFNCLCPDLCVHVTTYPPRWGKGRKH